MRRFAQMMTKDQVMTPKRRFDPRLVSRVADALMYSSYRKLLCSGTPFVNVAGSRTKQRFEMPVPISTPVDPHLQVGASFTRLLV
jgi:hypothetical protein